LIKLHCEYHRMLEHVGINEDYEAGYRVKPNNEVDPVLMLRKKLVNHLGDASVTSVIENKIDKKVQKSLKMAKEMSII